MPDQKRDPKTERAIRVMSLLIVNRLKQKRGLTDEDLRSVDWQEQIREMALDALKNGKQVVLEYE